MAEKAKRVNLDELSMGPIVPKAPSDAMPPDFYSDKANAGLGLAPMASGGPPRRISDLLTKALQKVGRR